LVVLSLFATACRRDGAGVAAVGRNEDAEQLGQVSSALVAGRTVEIWSAGGPSFLYPEGTHRIDADLAMWLVIQPCLDAERARLHGGEAAFFGGATDLAYCPTKKPLSGTSRGLDLDHGADLEVMLVLSCAAHWANYIATSASPAHVSLREACLDEDQCVTNFIVHTKEGELGKPWSDSVVPTELQPFVRVDPPSPSDAATWGLLSSELFREAVAVGTTLLSCANGDGPGVDEVFTTDDGISATASEYLVSTLADALSSSMESVAQTEKLIGAAADAARASNADPAMGLVQSWASRHDSRLEIAELVGRVPEDQFHEIQPLALMQVFSVVSGAPDRSFYTLHAGLPEVVSASRVHWESSGSTGSPQTEVLTKYLIPYGAGVPTDGKLMATYRVIGKPGVLFTTTRDAAWLTSKIGENVELVRYEGWTVPAGPDTTTFKTVRTQAKTGSRSAVLEFWASTATIPPGQDMGEEFSLLNSHTARPDEALKRFPVASLLATTPTSKKADQLLRTSRVNPCMSTMTGEYAVWCRDALAGAVRTSENIQDDLLKALRNTDTTASRTVRITQLGTTPADIEQAAMRIVQQNMTLGRAIVPDPAKRSNPNLVFGTQPTSTPVSPAYLYARVAGRPDLNGPTLGLVSTDTQARADGYSRSSVLAAIDAFRDSAEKTLAAVPSEDADDSWVTILKQALAWSKQHVSYPLRVVTRVAADASAERVSSLSLELQDLQITDDVTAKAMCSAWLNEAGLECALTGRVGGYNCDASKHRFAKPNTTWVTFAPDLGEAKKWVKFALTPALAPERQGVGKALLAGDRIYLTCGFEDRVEVLFATTIARPLTVGTWTAYLPPFSDTLQDHLVATLAADAGQPELGALSCAGVPTDVRLPLADEITDALTGAHDVESSFAHYLKLSRDAANEANVLGEELIRQGVEMDMRSEQARDELEDLCGGQIDVPALQDWSCDPASDADCDLSKLLATGYENAPVEVKRDLEGLKDCLGENESLKPVNASLGDQRMCAWRFLSPGESLAPCACPAATLRSVDPSNYDTFCPNKKECPVVRSSSGTCTAIYPSITQNADSAPAGFSGFAYVDITDTLNVSVSAINSGDITIPAGTNFPCRDVMALRALASAPRGSQSLLDAAYSHRISNWATQANLKRVAELIGYEEDLFGSPRLTVGGKPWITFVDGSGPRSDTAVGWPCGRESLIDGNIAGHDQVAAGYCGGQSSTSSLFCGGHCGTAPATSPERFATMSGALAARMRNAVVALKAVSGAPTNNVIFKKDTAALMSLDTIPATMRIAGAMPAWHPWAGSLYARSTDGKRLCAKRGFNNTVTCTTTQLYEDSLPFEQPWPRDPWFLYATEDARWYCPDYEESTAVAGRNVIGKLRPNGCADMQELFKGQSKSVNVSVNREQVQVCSRLPGSLCAISLRETTSGASSTPLLCGEQLKFWDEISKPAPGPLSDTQRSQYRSVLKPKLWAARVGEDNRLWSSEDELWEFFGTQIARCERHENRSGSQTDCMQYSNASMVESLDKVLQDATLGPEHRELLLTARTKHLHWAVLASAGCSRDNPNDTARTDNVIGSTIPWPQVLDGLELACAQISNPVIGCETLLDTSFKPKDLDDFATLSGRVRCAADRVEGTIEKMWLHAIPSDVVKGVRERSVASVFPAHRGHYGEAIAALASELENSGRQADAVVQALRDLKLEMDASALELNKLDLQESIDRVDVYIEGLQADADELQAKISTVRTRQAISSNVTSCVAAVASAAGNWTDTATGQNAGNMVAATATCANSVVQIYSELEVAGLQAGINNINDQVHKAVIEKIKLGQRITEKEKQIVLIGVARQVNLALDKMNEALHGLKESYARIQGHLASMERIRQDGRRAAAKVLMLGNDDLGRVYAVNSAMRARMNTLRIRYENARDNAIQLSFLARRAVEQKFGVDLSQLDRDLLLVEAPRKWADRLCTMSGIDYDRVRTSGSDLGFEYSGEYLGDWLDRLEAFVDSYRVDYPFNAGSDLAVISLRDEVVNAYESCELEGWNQLYFTDGSFNERSSIDASSPGWQYSCEQNGGAATLASVETTTSTPFACARSSLDCADSPDGCGVLASPEECRAEGTPRAVLLSAATVDACQTAPDQEVGSGDGDVPSSGLFYRFRADACRVTNTTALNDKICTDLATNTDLLTWRSGPIPALIPDGIGGRTTIALGAGTQLTSNPLTSAVSAYTVTWVFRKGPSGTATSHANVPTLPNGRMPLARWVVNNSLYHGFEQATNWASPYTFRQQRYSALSRVPPQLSPRSGDVLTLRANASGVELWYNGVLRARGDQPGVPSTLGSQVVVTQNPGDALELAEALAYSRSLSDSELQDLHTELGQYYAIDLTRPTYSLSGPSIEPMRTAEGDPRSGYKFPGDTGIRDAANGQLAQVVRGGIETQALVSFGGTGPQALVFDGVDDQIGFRASAAATVYRSDGAAVEYPLVAANEYSVTMVANCQDGRAHRLFASHHTASAAGLLLDLSSTGQVIVRNVAAGTVRTTPHGEVTCGVPFVITLRGSQALGTTDVFVNGALIDSDEQFRAMPLAPAFGGGAAPGTANLFFKGQLAEAQLHLQEMNDDDVLALQRSFAAVYGIPLDSEGGGSSGTPVTVVAGPARMRQVVDVEAAPHWLSWYQKSSEAPLTVLVEYLAEGDSETFTPTLHEEDTILAYVDWSEAPHGSRTGHLTEELAEGWVRYFLQVEPMRAGQLAVGFVPTTTAVSFAAPQLERIDDWLSAAPEPYFLTSASLSRSIDRCEDEDGSTFRSLWRRGCEYYCPPGEGTLCAAGTSTTHLPQRCFYEIDFGLSLEEIEKGTLIPEAGFSRGNFNYRFEDLALNLVGTGVKDCSLSATPSSCYAGSFLQYSLYQSEPFRVRNYDGNVVRAPLPSGRIQQAKALLAERYLTNPLSGADSSLIGSYFRNEFNGRPLDGNFKLRIYDTDGLNFRALEDVQIALRYRYWTRAE
jgi:hypothetical protein